MEYKNSKISESNKKKIIKELFNDVSKEIYTNSSS